MVRMKLDFPEINVSRASLEPKVVAMSKRAQVKFYACSEHVYTLSTPMDLHFRYFDA